MAWSDCDQKKRFHGKRQLRGTVQKQIQFEIYAFYSPTCLKYYNTWMLRIVNEYFQRNIRFQNPKFEKNLLKALNDTASAQCQKKIALVNIFHNLIKMPSAPCYKYYMYMKSNLITCLHSAMQPHKLTLYLFRLHASCTRIDKFLNTPQNI